jgi:putative SOS response-associated peptidase YedK
MCGRFSHRLSWQEIQALYQLTSARSNLEPRYNVCRTDTISAVVERDGRRELVPMGWGLEKTRVRSVILIACEVKDHCRCMASPTRWRDRRRRLRLNGTPK